VILRLMPGLGVDSVKLDRSMIEALTTEWGRTLMTATLDKASELGVDVTAVGVETPEQLAMLRLFGCSHVQGYLIGRPLPPENVAAALAELSDQGSSSRPGVR
jgi:EAL domain-containing protein (putative c-di-GMP-specific phosphodiesterase class I)